MFWYFLIIFWIYAVCITLHLIDFIFLQDNDLSWNTSQPDLTLCFQKTILVWIPCWFLWLMIPLLIYMLRRSNLRNRKWTWNSLTKMVLITFIFLHVAFSFVYILDYSVDCSHHSRRGFTDRPDDGTVQIQPKWQWSRSSCRHNCSSYEADIVCTCSILPTCCIVCFETFFVIVLHSGRCCSFHLHG